jgi:molybdopterin converting factor small subunit
MTTVTFTQHLRRLVGPEPIQVDGATLGAALDQVFQSHPRLRRYILDDQNRLRRHVAIFVDGRRIKARPDLSDPLPDDAQVYVLQALSGG